MNSRATTICVCLAALLAVAMAHIPIVEVVGSADPFDDTQPSGKYAEAAAKVEAAIEAEKLVDTRPKVYHFNCALSEHAQFELVRTIRAGNHSFVDIYFSGTCMGYYFMLPLFFAADDSVYRMYGPARIMTAGQVLYVLHGRVELYNLVFDHSGASHPLFADYETPLRTAYTVRFAQCDFINFGSLPAGAEPDQGLTMADVHLLLTAEDMSNKEKMAKMGIIWIQFENTDAGRLELDKVRMTNVRRNAVRVLGAREVVIDQWECDMCGAPFLTIDWHENVLVDGYYLELTNSEFVMMPRRAKANAIVASQNEDDEPADTAAGIEMGNVPGDVRIMRNEFRDFDAPISRPSLFQLGVEGKNKV